jgi:hypothetical protein
VQGRGDRVGFCRDAVEEVAVERVQFHDPCVSR